MERAWRAVGQFVDGLRDLVRVLYKTPHGC